MAYIDYHLYLQSPRWAALRSKYITQNPSTRCFICGKRFFLQLHHTDYSQLGKERINHNLFVVCDTCHRKANFLLYFLKLPFSKRLLTMRIYYLKSSHCIQNWQILPSVWFAVRFMVAATNLERR